MKVHEILRTVRGGLTQKAFAQIIGCPQSYVSRYENEIHRPPAKYLAAVAKYAGLTIEALLDEKGIRGEAVEGKPKHAIAEERFSVIYGKEAGEKLLGLVEALLRDRELYIKHDDLVAAVAEVVKHTGQIAREREADEKVRAKSQARRKGRKSSA